MSQTEHPIPVPEFEGYTEAEVHHHVGLCAEAEYMVLHMPETETPPRRFRGILRLTWAGYEALDRMRNSQSGV